MPPPAPPHPLLSLALTACLSGPPLLGAATSLATLSAVKEGVGRKATRSSTIGALVEFSSVVSRKVVLPTLRCCTAVRREGRVKHTEGR